MTTVTATQESPFSLLGKMSRARAGSLPVVLGLAVIWAVFAFQNENFLSARNLTNLVVQIAAMGTMSIGVVLVLLIGEIDLSAGSVSGLAAGVMAILNVKHGWGPWLSIAAAIATGALAGGVQGAWFARFRVPSFVVTLAGLLGLQGALLWTLGSTGTINIHDEVIESLAGTFLSPPLAWALAGFGMTATLVGEIASARRRSSARLSASSRRAVVARIVAVWTMAVATVALLNAHRGVPLAFVLLIGFVVVFDLLVRRTRFGRHILAVGGNADAARRAGIDPNAIRIAVFALSGALAAFGGVLAASRLLAVSQSSGGGDALLNAIASAVLGGTSLFGGKGTIWSALTGALVIGSISNGLDLLAHPSSVKFMVTGAALLVAVTVDALSRRTS